MIEVGQDAPDFTLPGVENGAKRDYTLSEYRGPQGRARVLPR